jgi:hypothetical protein
LDEGLQKIPGQPPLPENWRKGRSAARSPLGSYSAHASWKKGDTQSDEGDNGSKDHAVRGQASHFFIPQYEGGDKEPNPNDDLNDHPKN